MILDNTALNQTVLPKHRSSQRAVLSALPWVFAFFFAAGAILSASQLPSRFPSTEVPATAISVTAEGKQVLPPVRIRIPALGVDAPVVNLGLNRNRTLQVPKGDSEVGWYTGSPAPGAVGPAVMVGHLDSVRGPAIFQDLHKLKFGDVIEVVHEDGSVTVFQMDNSETFSQSKFPTEKVYGTIDYPGLRLITCAGTYSTLKGRYSDNLVVFASLKK